MTRSAADVLKEQRERGGVIVPATKTGVTNGSPLTPAYFGSDFASPTRGTPIKFGKNGYETPDGETIPEGSQFIAVFDQSYAGYIRFNGEGNPPDRVQGLIFEGFIPPERSTLGDTDETQWKIGLSGRPEDPWQKQLLLPLQRVEDGKLFVFQTTSTTGRRAVDELLAACVRMQRSDPDQYPVIRFDVGGFQHKDSRIGWVKTPKFTRVGTAPKADTTKADTSLSGDLDDEIPF
jgi:hypothetical protein